MDVCWLMGQSRKNHKGDCSGYGTWLQEVILEGLQEQNREMQRTEVGREKVSWKVVWGRLWRADGELVTCALPTVSHKCFPLGKNQNRSTFFKSNLGKIGLFTWVLLAQSKASPLHSSIWGPLRSETSLLSAHPKAGWKVLTRYTELQVSFPI